MHGFRNTLLSVGLITAIFLVQAAAQSSVQVQLGMILDGSQSINPADWNQVIQGLSIAVNGPDFPKDGSIELTIVQIGQVNNCVSTQGSKLEVGPSVVTSKNINSIVSQINSIKQLQGSTPLACGLFQLADIISASPNFDPKISQVIDLITDGEPNIECAAGSSCGLSNTQIPVPAAQSNTKIARDYAISTLQMIPDKDRIHAELVTKQLSQQQIAQMTTWLKNQIVWPQTGQIAVPPNFPTNTGFVVVVKDFKEVRDTINQKIKASIPPRPKPHNESVSHNNQINQNINQNVLAVSGNGIGPGRSIWLPQNGDNTANVNGQNNQIDQNINQNAEGISQNALGGKIN